MLATLRNMADLNDTNLPLFPLDFHCQVRLLNLTEPLLSVTVTQLRKKRHSQFAVKRLVD
jgi:hypothetical protein